MNDVNPSLIKVYARAEDINAKPKALSPIQEEEQHANTTFWNLDAPKRIAKEVYPFSVSAIV